jgi:glycosyltransferase involved in cell wall biosynthesis
MKGTGNARKVTVVIPTYNRAHLLRGCIQSVLAQSFPDLEVVVIDDGSTDNTSQVVSTFPVRYYRQENEGAPAARNKGLSLAGGEYVIFLDSDDILLVDAVAKGVAVLDEHPEVGFSYGKCYIIDEKGRTLGMIKSRLKSSCIRQGKEEIADLIFGNDIPPAAVMARRRCLEEVGGFAPAFHFGSQDFELWVRLAKRYAVAYIAEPLAKFRVHEHNMTSSRTPGEMEQTRSLILESIFNDDELGPFLSAQRPAAYSHLYRQLAEHAYSRREMRAARHYLYRSAKACPLAFFKGLGLSHTILLAKTCVPSPILASARTCRRYISAGACRFLSNRGQVRLEAIDLDPAPGKAGSEVGER